MRSLRRHSSPPAADPFAPIEVAVGAMLGLVAVVVSAILVLAGVQAVSGHGDVTFFGFQDTVCVEAEAGPIGIQGSADGVDEFPTTSARGSTTPSEYSVCADRASLGEQVAASADGLLSLVLVVGAGVLVRRTIRTARAVGLFTDDAAHTTRDLGWFLVVLSVAWPVGARTGAGVVVAAAIPDQDWWAQVTYGYPVSATLLLTGLGVLSFARILRLAVPLQDEADLTV